MKVAGFLIVLFLLYSGRAFIIALRHIGTSPAVAVLLTIAVVLAASRLGRRT